MLMAATKLNHKTRKIGDKKTLTFWQVALASSGRGRRIFFFLLREAEKERKKERKRARERERDRERCSIRRTAGPPALMSPASTRPD